MILLDVGNLWHGCRRITGRKGARVDFKKVLDRFRSKERKVVAYVVTPRFPGEPVRNVGFVGALRSLGIEVRQVHVEARREGTEVFVGRAHSSVYDMMMEDYSKLGEGVDEVVIVSGAGKVIPLAQRAKEEGRRLIVACFVAVGDLNTVLREVADEVVTLDASLVYDGKEGGR